MAQPYVGEIRMFAGNFPPAGWLFCDGSQLSISENETLFQLIGTTYGGDGEETFNVPNLQSRVPVHFDPSNGLPLAQMAGVEEVTLTVQQIPVHTHPLLGSAIAGNQVSPVNATPANSQNVIPYRNTSTDSNMHPASIMPVGGSQPHTNLQPFLAVNFIISLFGIFPSPT